MSSTELQEQWHVAANEHLKIKPQSNIKAVWQCIKCPAGQPHVWTAIVGSRTLGSQCLFCCNRLVCLHNSLATAAPDAARYWDHSKNEKTPERMLAGSNFRAEWKCPDCNWEWQTPISMRTHTKSGCPKCSHAQTVKQPQPTCAQVQPVQLAEWDYKRMMPRGSVQKALPLAAPSWCTGSAHAVQEGSHTAGQHRQRTALEQAAGVQFVLAGKLVSATLWSL